MTEQLAAPPIVEGGGERPDSVPPAIFEAALATFLAGRRLDMRALALQLGIGRATLYRKAGGRDWLLGEVIWYLTRRALVDALERTVTLRGAERVLAVAGRFMAFVCDEASFRRFLDEEPEAALRILTSKNGPVQRGIVEAQRRLLEEEQRIGGLELTIDSATLAYVIVRIGESFLYADVIADSEPDVEQALEVMTRLIAPGRPVVT
ncbi:MAG: QsdR family transcriptional regulator [Thermoleophilaceae bacterium]